MAFQRADYVSLNRGGTPSTAGGVTGTYYVDQITGLEKLIGIPLLSTDLGGVAPTTPGPHAYIDNTASPDRLYIWDSSANAYVVFAGVSGGDLVGTYTPSAALPSATNITAAGDYFLVASAGAAGQPFAGVTLNANDEIVALVAAPAVAGDWYVRAKAQSYSAFIASGASHTGGLVPDPGATAGTTKFLREDATWATPTTPPTSAWMAAALAP